MIDGVSLALRSTLGFLFVSGGLTEDRRESRISQTDTGFWRFWIFHASRFSDELKLVVMGRHSWRSTACLRSHVV